MTVSKFGPTPESYTPKHLAEKILTSKTALEGERKLVTVLFCDIANSTMLAEHLGPEGMHALLQIFFDLALAEIHRYEGTVNQFLGDGFMALFGAPIGHEDHAQRGVLAALDIRRSLRDHADELATEGQPFEVRMGRNTGPVVVGKIGDNLRMDYTAIGDTTNLAARLQQHAEVGGIVVSDTTARLVDKVVRLAPRLPMAVKGRAELVHASIVVGPVVRSSALEGGEQRALTEWVGRDDELATLQHILVDVGGGRGRAVSVIGEPGVGKSRLLYEFSRSLPAAGVCTLVGRCVSYGRSIPYVPIHGVIREHLGITGAEAASAVADKVHQALTALGTDAKESAPYLLRLLGADSGTDGLDRLVPEAIKAGIFKAIRGLVLGLGQDRPAVIVVEDLHWIDATSEELLGQIVGGLEGSAIMLVTTCRPEYREPWLDRPWASQVLLRPLSHAASARIVSSLAGHTGISPATADAVVRKAEGNPFIVEELTKAVLESGVGIAGIPQTVHGVLQARIDRLPDETKRVLQTAAVLGRECPLSLLDIVCEGISTLPLHMEYLTRLEFLYESASGSEITYVFKHALTQDVAYQSLLTPRRMALHAAAALAFERLHGGRLEAVTDDLAYHYTNAGNAPKAIEWLGRAADKATRANAHREAVAAYQGALTHAERLPVNERDRTVVELTLRQAESLFLLGRIPEASELLAHHQPVLERLVNPSLSGPYNFLLGYMYSLLGSAAPAIAHATRAIEMARRAEDLATMGKAHCTLALEAFFAGDLHNGMSHARDAVSLQERSDPGFWLATGHWVHGLAAAYSGGFEAALRAEREATEIARRIGSRSMEAHAGWGLAWALMHRGDIHEAITTAQHTLDISPEPHSRVFAMWALGWAMLEAARSADAITWFEQVVDLLKAFRHRAQGMAMDLLAEALLPGDAIERARTLAEEGLRLSEDRQFRIGIAAGHRTLGRVALAERRVAAARSHLETASTIWAEIGARPDLGRTHLVMADCDETDGDESQMRRHLETAREIFRAMDAPALVRRTEEWARARGVTLAG